MVTLGCSRTVVPVTFGDTGRDGKEKSICGTVTYIHPQRRFCLMEFAVKGGIIRESFRLVEGEIAQ